MRARAPRNTRVRACVCVCVCGIFVADVCDVSMQERSFIIVVISLSHQCRARTGISHVLTWLGTTRRNLVG